MSAIVNGHMIPDPTVKPVDVLSPRGSRPLDAVWVRKSTKRPNFVTITSGSTTTLYSVRGNGALNEKAVIRWEGASDADAKKPNATVTIEGREYPAESFGRTNSGSRGATSVHRLETDGVQWQWKMKAEKVSDPHRESFSDTLHWRCTADISTEKRLATTNLDPSPSRRLRSLFRTSAKTKEAKALLATYQPGTFYFSRSEVGLSIHSEGLPYIFQLLLSAILIDTRKDDWKLMQSRNTPQQLEAMFSSDIAGELPRYASRADLHSTLPVASSWRWDARHDSRQRGVPTPAPLYEQA